MDTETDGHGTLGVGSPRCINLQGITAYQTDYSMAALAIKAEGSPLQPADGSPFKLPMASLDGKPGTFLYNVKPLVVCTSTEVAVLQS